MNLRHDVSAVVFDLDGTLIDSRRDLAGAVNALRRELGFEPLAVETVVGMVGRGARVLVRRALADRLSVALDPAALERAFARFLDLYFDRCLEETTPYPGVPAMLEALVGSRPLAILTNKPERHTGRILDGLGLAGLFREVIGGDTLASRKPDPEGLRRLSRRFGSSVDATLFVGDSATDAETAGAAGSPLVLVGWGFGAAEELERFDAVLRPETPAELAAALLGNEP